MQQMPRRRSNSLPIPKIEVSIYQSPESKKKDVLKDFIEVPDTRDVSLLTGTYFQVPNFFLLCADLVTFSKSHKGHESDSSHTRRASEKSKKRMKMADLKAFVETKLLSKSDKALEKIGQEEPKMLFEQVSECFDCLNLMSYDFFCVIFLLVNVIILLCMLYLFITSIFRNVTEVSILETII